MSDFKGIMKGGWHPKGKEGGKESWRGDFKGINQVAGWMGKGKQPGSGSEGSDHVSRPLATLKDPAAFGPPPRNVNYHGGAALPNQITPHTGGIGAPLTQAQIREAEEAVRRQKQEEVEAEEAEAENARPAGPPLPYRADRTGLKTDHLPPPPVHRDIASSTSSAINGNVQATPKPRPNLPPRLPSRQQSSSSSIVAVPPSAQPPPYETTIQQFAPQPVIKNGGINTAAIGRLGKAGVSVPGFGIGEANPWKNEQSNSSPAPVASNTPQLSELQSRFSRMNTGSATPQSPPAEGTTMEQKQAAFKTAQNFHKDPSSVTIADAQSAASTANNFRARHQEQISAGAQKANQWNKKFNVTTRVNTFLEKQASPVSEQPPAVSSLPLASPTASDVSAISRKPPPPPPPKKPAGMHAPPPVPIGTKPSFG